MWRHDAFMGAPEPPWAPQELPTTEDDPWQLRPDDVRRRRTRGSPVLATTSCASATEPVPDLPFELWLASEVAEAMPQVAALRPGHGVGGTGDTVG
jgi:hypothetical protein